MAKTQGPPNLIFFFTDQQRWDTLGCYGQPLAVTPNLDRLAADGVRFEYAFTPQPVCGPARACLQTGRYATETGCYVNGIALDPKEHGLAPRGRRFRVIGKRDLRGDAKAHVEGLCEKGPGMADAGKRRAG